MQGGVRMAQIALIQAADFFIEKDAVRQPMHAMHHHATHELYYQIQGEREYFIEDRFFKIREGDLVLIPRGLLHRTAGRGTTRFLVHVSDKFLMRFFTKEALGELFSGGPLVFRGEELLRDRISDLLHTLLAEYHRPDRTLSDANDRVLAGYLYQILFAVMCANNLYVPEAFADERIAQVIKYINENYGSIKDIEEIAARFFISKFHLCRIFNKNLGIPLVTYLNTIKIREACTMIKEGRYNLTEIAMKCGFNSSSYFCKVFKSEKGISPTEYKKKKKLSK